MKYRIPRSGPLSNLRMSEGKGMTCSIISASLRCRIVAHRDVCLPCSDEGLKILQICNNCPIFFCYSDIWFVLPLTSGMAILVPSKSSSVRLWWPENVFVTNSEWTFRYTRWLNGRMFFYSVNFHDSPPVNVQVSSRNLEKCSSLPVDARTSSCVRPLVFEPQKYSSWSVVPTRVNPSPQATC